MKSEVLLGTQGWKVGAWVGPFYPLGTRGTQMLPLYGRAFATVEVASTSYAVPARPVVADWAAQVPPGFEFALKVPQQVTHERRFTDTEKILRRFVQRIEGLGPALGPLLLQVPTGFRPTDENRDLLRRFLEQLPTGFRWAAEFRHPGWLTGHTTDLLRRSNVATVLPDSRWIRRELVVELAVEPTADFSYVRWNGAGRRLTDVSRAQIDRERELDIWADVIDSLRDRVLKVYGYFDDQYQGHGPHSVRALQTRIGQEPVQPEALSEQPELF